VNTVLLIPVSLARRNQRALVGIFYENLPVCRPASTRFETIKVKSLKNNQIVILGTSLALSITSFIGPEEAERPPGEGRASQPWMGCPPGDRSEGKDEEQGVSLQDAGCGTRLSRTTTRTTNSVR
jgi:hypothetical protein